MIDKKSVAGSPVTRKRHTPAFKAECVRQVAAGARQTDMARAQGISPALLGRWQRTALEQAVPSSTERDGIKRLRAELKRAASTVSKHLFISTQVDTWTLTDLCRVLGVSHSD